MLGEYLFYDNMNVCMFSVWNGDIAKAYSTQIISYILSDKGVSCKLNVNFSNVGFSFCWYRAVNHLLRIGNIDVITGISIGLAFAHAIDCNAKHIL